MNKYEVQQLIGQGSQANIYKAFCVKTKQLVAIKHYTGIDFYETEDVQQIVDEGKLLLALKHPNILKCYDLVKKPNDIYIITDYVDGITLQLFVELQFSKLVKLTAQNINAQKLVEFIEQHAKNPNLLDLYHSEIRKLYLNIASQSYQKVFKSDDIQTKILESCKTQLIQSYIPKTPMNISRMSITNRSDNFSDLSDSFSVLHINSLNSANDIDCVNQIPLVQKPNSQASTSTNSLHVTSQHKQSPKVQQRKAVQKSWLEIVENVLLQLLYVLSYLHEKDIVHRDLKPENIMVVYDEQRQIFLIKLIDFGFAQQNPTQKLLVGTPGYISPEVYLSDHHFRRYSKATDMWGCGAILYFMLCGYPPYITTRNVYFQKLQIARGLYMPMDLNPETQIPQMFRRLMFQLLCVNPEIRLKAPEAIEIIKICNKTRLLVDVEKQLRPSYYQIKIVVLGNLGVGKSTIVNQLKTSQLTSNADRLFMLFNDQDLIKIMVTEPGGLEHEEMRLNPALLRNINICLLVFSPDIKESFQQLDYWKEALQLFSPSAVIKYVYNKYDLAEQYDDDGKYEKTGIKMYKLSAVVDTQFKDLLEDLVVEAIATQNFDVKQPDNVQVSDVQNKSKKQQEC